MRTYEVVNLSNMKVQALLYDDVDSAFIAIEPRSLVFVVPNTVEKLSNAYCADKRVFTSHIGTWLIRRKQCTNPV